MSEKLRATEISESEKDNRPPKKKQKQGKAKRAQKEKQNRQAKPKRTANKPKRARAKTQHGRKTD